MADTIIPNTGDPRVDAALARVRDKFTELEDAMLIQVHLERFAAERTKEHAHVLAAHERALAEHEAWLGRMQAMAEDAAKRDRVLDERIQSLVSAIGEFISNLPAR